MSHHGAYYVIALENRASVATVLVAMVTVAHACACNGRKTQENTCSVVVDEDQELCDRSEAVPSAPASIQHKLSRLSAPLGVFPLPNLIPAFSLTQLVS